MARCQHNRTGDDPVPFIVIDQKSSSMTEQTTSPAASETPAMWRSKLGTNYPKDFMETNEARLLKEVQAIRDLPENSICADCGIRGTVWASVNLGVFLCMTCGAHHRSLGTHISLPKGCTGTYWWGPDEIEQMKTKGNAHAKVEFGGSKPSKSFNKDDALRWKQYLTDKYVHKKFATAANPSLSASAEQRGDPASISPPRISPRFVKKSARFSNNKPMPTLEFMHFENKSPVSPKSTVVSPGGVSVPSPTLKGSQLTPLAGTGEDFFAEFGV